MAGASAWCRQVAAAVGRREGPEAPRYTTPHLSSLALSYCCSSRRLWHVGVGGVGGWGLSWTEEVTCPFRFPRSLTEAMQAEVYIAEGITPKHKAFEIRAD